MRFFDADYQASLTAARDGGIAPAYFLHVIAKDRATGADRPIGLWSGDEDISVNVISPSGGMTTRTYIGGVNLKLPDGIPYAADLTDNPVSVSLSQIAPATQELIRGYDARLAYCEIHATTWTGGRLTSAPDVDWIGIIDAASIETPQADSDGNISLSIRSEIMSQLTAINPAKSSDAHQRRRNSADRFSEYSGKIGSRVLQWFKG